jgi:hypothetical protein
MRDCGKRAITSGCFERTTDTRELARYIINNPVRGDLVESPADYPFLGSDVWSLAELFEITV